MIDNYSVCGEFLQGVAIVWSELKGWRDKHSNPCAEVKRFRENERNRILRPDEIRRVLEALASYGQYENRKCWAATWAIRLLMITGLRRNEWCKARWEYLDEDAGTLTLPDTKTGPRTVHLSRMAFDLLREVRKQSNSEWIFPTWDGERPLMGLGHHWRAIRKAAGVPDVRIHDLRHTVGSLAHRKGLSQKEIAELLGHRHMKTTARYIHTYDEGKRDNADIAAAAVMDAWKIDATVH